MVSPSDVAARRWTRDGVECGGEAVGGEILQVALLQPGGSVPSSGDRPTHCASFTRFQTMLLKDRFSIDSTSDKERSRVKSYGPCQCDIFFCFNCSFLHFIVERYWEIEAHKPEEFWTINCSHESEDGLATKAENKYVMFYNLFIGFFGLIC
ncbi:unnamed protein product [Brassica oleracea]